MTREQATGRHRVRWRLVTVLLLTGMAGSGIADERVWVPALPSFLTSPEIAVASFAGRTLVVDHEVALMAEGSGPWYRLPWRPGSPPHEAIWAGDRFVVLLRDNVAWSADGMLWSESDRPSVGGSFMGLLQTDGGLLAVEIEGETWRSTNGGRTWRQVHDTLSGGGYDVGIRDGVVSAGLVVLVGRRSWRSADGWQHDGVVYVSVDGGQSYDRVLTIDDTTLSSLVVTADGFAATGEHEVLVSSSDGYEWATSETSGANPGDRSLRNLVWSPQGWFATSTQRVDPGDAPMCTIYRSEDGLSWVPYAERRAILYDLQWTASGLLAVGWGAVYRLEDGGVWSTMLEAAYPERLGTTANRVVAVGRTIEQFTNYSMYFGTSSWTADGLHWQDSLPPWSGWPWYELKDVVGGAGVFVATNGGGSVAVWNGAGDRWLSAVLGSGSYDVVTWGEGRFAAVGSGSAAWSLDGLSWAQSTVDGFLTPRAVASGGGRFVAVGNELHWSAPGGSWHASSSDPQGVLEDVVWTGTEFVAVGWNGEVLCSADGETWRWEPPFTQSKLDAVFMMDGEVHASGDEQLWRREGGEWVEQAPPPGLVTVADATELVGNPVVVGPASDMGYGRSRQQILVGLEDETFSWCWAVTGLERGQITDGTFSVSNIALYNPGELSVVCRLTGLAGEGSLVLPVAPKSRLAVRSVLQQLGVAEGPGSILVHANGPLQPSATVATMTGESTVIASARRAVSVEPSERWLAPGDERLIVASGEPWTQLKLAAANVGPVDATLVIREYGQLGTQLAERSLAMAPGETVQSGAADIQTVWMALEVVSGDPAARVTAAGWVVDLASGDAAAAGPFDARDSPAIVPAVAHLRGWRSIVTVVNPGPTAATYRLELHPRWGSGPPQTVTFALAPGVAARYADVVSDPFDATGGAALTVVPVEGRIAVASWSVAEAGGGRVWQATVPQPAVSLAPDRPVVLSGLESWASGGLGRRSNLALTSMSDEATVVDVVLRDAGGAELDRRRFDLPGHGHVQLDRVFAGVAPYGVSGGSAEIAASGGSLVVAAFVVDQRTNDGLTVDAAVGQRR